jgi:hypothetical protein
MDDKHPILIDLVSKLANMQVIAVEVDECVNFGIDIDTIKETFPWFVETVDGKEYINYVQVLIYLLGTVKEIYDLVYDLQMDLGKLKNNNSTN